jgi:hypothetical protein
MHYQKEQISSLIGGSQSQLLRRQRSGGLCFEASPGQIVCETLSQKNPSHKRTGGMTQLIERLPSKCKALSSNPNARKKDTEQKKERKNT